MFRSVVVALVVVGGACSGASALTGSGDSAVGALETVPPLVTGPTAAPAEASANETVTISFDTSEDVPLVPSVTVNGNVAAFVSGAKATGFTYEYTVLESEPIGGAVIEIVASDAVGNTATVNDNAALSIIEPAASVPLRAWPTAVALLFAAMAVLALRRRRAASEGGSRGLFFFLAALLVAPAALAQGPTVSNVSFVQQPTVTGTEVIITYDLVSLNGSSDITVSLSKDGGADAFSFPVTSVTGDLAGVVTGTGYTITWDIAADYPNEEIPNAQLRVTADDGFVVPPVEMIPVAAGSFEMGHSGVGDDANYGTGEELPVHTVTLSPYEIGKFEITNQQVCDVFNWADNQGLFTTVNGNTATAYGQELLDLASGNSHIEYVNGVFQPETRTGLPGTTTYSMAQHPVLEISWYGAALYCNWLSELEGLTPVYDTATWAANFSNNGYHLPTEAQWERAAAWDGSKHWIYGNTSDTQPNINRANFFPSNPLGLSSMPHTSPVGWYNGVNISPRTNAATINSASPIGAYDMSGNLYEWCHDWADTGYYAVSPPIDPAGPASTGTRILRGGFWLEPAVRGRTAYRLGGTPSGTGDAVGFRLARTTAYTLSYSAGVGGSLTGNAAQTVLPGEDGAPVTAVADSGFVFSGWSDGVTDNPRTDTSVSSGVLATANFIALPEMISVAAGSFDMGRPSGGGPSEELPVHAVTLSAYEIGKFEITNQQVCDVFNWADDQGLFTTVDATTAQAYGQTLLDLGDSESHIEYLGGVFQPEDRTGAPGGSTVYSMAQHPALNISWFGAVAYCNWLSQMEGLTPVYDTSTWTANFANDGYHLPTEAQWERAAAWDGTKHWIYGFTSDTPSNFDRANHLDPGATRTNPLGLTTDPMTSPVGWFNGVNVSPNGNIATVDSVSPIGAYDMSGNVGEWCHDWYDSGYYAVSPAADPEGPASGSDRVYRGGSWRNPEDSCRSARRAGFLPSVLDFSIGFRLAR